LKEREFIKTNEHIYKIGKTKQKNLKRIQNYPNGTCLLFQIICKNCDLLERKIIDNFKKKYKLRKDVGNEYFEGNYIEMINDIYNIVFNNNSSNIEINENNKSNKKDEFITKAKMTKEDFDKKDTHNDENENPCILCGEMKYRCGLLVCYDKVKVLPDYREIDEEDSCTFELKCEDKQAYFWVCRDCECDGDIVKIVPIIYFPEINKRFLTADYYSYCS